MVYGIVAAVQAVVPLIIFVTIKAFWPAYLNGTALVLMMAGIWTPVFTVWLAVVVFDSKEYRELFQEAVDLSTAGPYMLYLVGIADLMIKGAWGDLGFWLCLIFTTIFTVGSIIYAAIFVPKVTNWIKNTPIKVYPIAKQADAPPAQQLLERINYAFDF